jgi:hypothetical protein
VLFRSLYWSSKRSNHHAAPPVKGSTTTITATMNSLLMVDNITALIATCKKYVKNFCKYSQLEYFQQLWIMRLFKNAPEQEWRKARKNCKVRRMLICRVAEFAAQQSNAAPALDSEAV